MDVLWPNRAAELAGGWPVVEPSGQSFLSLFTSQFVYKTLVNVEAVRVKYTRLIPIALFFISFSAHHSFFRV